ncbi:efflux RND transporter periplasmic adaptor subunit [Gaetbulibacter sp. NE]|uniref:efflux RND transporter periplasmic adaptor subunit n=1 Tax=Gaetbulibacter sp. NE TaxID=2982307 RepID=UPI0021D2AFBF|nr:HlyD family efflux transporter periplasmic adaptor subunit [Gaetbulibacter sp. NE]
MRKLILSAIGLVIILLAVFGAYLIIENSNKPKPRIEKVVKTVFAETVTNTTVPITIPANGTLVAKHKLELYSEVQGVFQSSAHDFKAGQPYRKGESLIRINSSEYYASVQSAKSDLYNLITSIMPDLRLDYPEVFPAWEAYLKNFDISKSVAPLPESTNEKANYFITGRGIVSSYYNIKNLEQRLSKYSIYAPFNGILTEALVTKGTLVRSGQKLGEYIDTSVYELELAISKTFSDLLQIGEKVELNTLEGNQTYIGNVTRVNGRIDQATQTIKVFVEVKGDNLKEGMFLEANLEAKDEPNAIKISRKLLVDESEIFIIKDSILDLIQVKPVYFSPKEVVIKGVPDGTKILSKSVPGAYAGMLVKVNQESTSQQTNN